MTGRRSMQFLFRPPILIALAGAAGLLVFLGVKLSSASASSSTSDSSIQAVAPLGVQPCYAHPQFIDPATCVANTMKALQAQQALFPASPSPGASALTESAIETIARSVNSAPSTSGIHAEAMAYEQAFADLGEKAGNPALALSLPVWLVTVDSPADVSYAPGDTDTVAPRYSVIIDSVNGGVIEMCAGCGPLDG